MRAYLTITFGLLEASRTAPSFLLHPLDLLGGDRVPELHYFPAMGMSTRKKRAHFTAIIKQMKRHYDVVSLDWFADAVADTPQRRRLL